MAVSVLHSAHVRDCTASHLFREILCIFPKGGEHCKATLGIASPKFFSSPSLYDAGALQSSQNGEKHSSLNNRRRNEPHWKTSGEAGLGLSDYLVDVMIDQTRVYCHHRIGRSHCGVPGSGRDSQTAAEVTP